MGDFNQLTELRNIVSPFVVNENEIRSVLHLDGDVGLSPERFAPQRPHVLPSRSRSEVGVHHDGNGFAVKVSIRFFDSPHSGALSSNGWQCDRPVEARMTRGFGFVSTCGMTRGKCGSHSRGRTKKPIRTALDRVSGGGDAAR